MSFVQMFWVLVYCLHRQPDSGALSLIYIKDYLQYRNFDTIHSLELIMISQSHNVYRIYFPHTNVELGLPASSSSSFTTFPAFAPVPTHACVLASHVLASRNIHAYTSSDPSLAYESKSAISRMKKLLPKFIANLKVNHSRMDELCQI